MNNEILPDKVRFANIPPSAKLFYAELVLMGGETTKTSQELALHMGCSDNAIKVWLQDLTKIGVIERIYRTKQGSNGIERTITVKKRS